MTTPDTRPQNGSDSQGIVEILANRTLIVASNRGPVTSSYSDDGSFTSRKGSGGVVTAVSSIAVLLRSASPNSPLPAGFAPAPHENMSQPQSRDSARRR